jgi:orotidine-5'-phosphate decarboxylase
MINNNKNFSQKFLELAKTRSPFCLGIDPTEELFKSWGLNFDIAGLKKMCEIIIAAAKDNLALVKPQSAYFERFGPKGMEVLQNLVKEFHKKETLVLLDAKKADIGATTLSYAKAYLGKESPYNFDAITVTSYMGFEALMPLLEYAKEQNCGVFIVVRSSNIEGSMIQKASITDKTSIADYLSQKINDFNHQISNQSIGPIGAVMGATLAFEDIKTTISKLNNCLILTPGIGHQGASFEDLKTNYQAILKNLIPTSSRAVLSKGPDIVSLRQEIIKNCQESLTAINL